MDPKQVNICMKIYLANIMLLSIVVIFPYKTQHCFAVEGVTIPFCLSFPFHIEVLEDLRYKLFKYL